MASQSPDTQEERQIDWPVFKPRLIGTVYEAPLSKSFHGANFRSRPTSRASDPTG